MIGAIVVDTSALMALLFEEPEAELVAVALAEATALRMAAPTWTEAAMVVTTRRGDAGYQQFRQILRRLAVEVVACDGGRQRWPFKLGCTTGKGVMGLA